MKSKRAEKYIEEHRDKHPYPSGDFSAGAAFEAVELAEEDMAEKAAKAYIQCCEWREGEDSCVAGYKCDKCPSMDNFKRKLME